MQIKINNWAKVVLVAGWLAVSVIGFMVKLPSRFHHQDKELHAAFYFLAAAFLNILFTDGKLLRHLLIFALLYCFSVGIEYAQDYSNHYFRNHIHGRYDPEDVKANLKGLIGYSVVWVLYRLIVSVTSRKSMSPEK